MSGVARRIIIAAAIALAAGAVINVAVAWTIAARAKPQWKQWGTIGAPWRFAPPAGWPEISSAGYGYSSAGWARGDEFAADADGGDGYHASWFDAGWPRPSMRTLRHERVPASAVPTSVPPPTSPATPGLFAMSDGTPPMAPIWPGFVRNTLLYSAAVGVLAAPVLLVAPVRRRWRARRGRCPRCGYELAGLEMCPECGSATA